MHNKKLSFLAVLIFIRLCISACSYLGFPTCFRLHSSADPENRDTALRRCCQWILNCFLSRVEG